VAHARSRLTPFGRQLLVHRVLVLGWPVPQAAEASGVSRATVYKWVRRHRTGGGFEDAPSRAHRRPHALPMWVEEQVRAARIELKQGPHRLSAALGMPRSTIYGVLRRHGMSRLRDFDRPTGKPIRYVRERPGELIHLDVKKLGRVPGGGGHLALGRQAGKRHSRGSNAVGYEFIHVAIDDCSRFAYVEVLDDERDQTTAAFLLRAANCLEGAGIHVERLLTDQGAAYRSHAFAAAVGKLGARHKFTRPYRPQTNGKAERFIRTMVEEWAYARIYTDNPARLSELASWLDFYNQRRPHTALGGRPPTAILVNNGDGNYT
jgi:transposase InsO family protein/predicted DNA-binding transcriptional regulator AlpA